MHRLTHWIIAALIVRLFGRSFPAPSIAGTSLCNYHALFLASRYSGQISLRIHMDAIHAGYIGWLYQPEYLVLF